MCGLRVFADRAVTLGHIPLNRVAGSLALDAVHRRTDPAPHLHARLGVVERDVREVVLFEVLLRQGDVEWLADRGLRRDHRRYRVGDRRRRSFDDQRRDRNRFRHARIRRCDRRNRGSAFLAGLADEDQDHDEPDAADERDERLEAALVGALGHLTLHLGRVLRDHRRLRPLRLRALVELAFVGVVSFRMDLRLRGGVVLRRRSRRNHRRNRGRRRSRGRRGRRNESLRRLNRSRSSRQLNARRRRNRRRRLCGRRRIRGRIIHRRRVSRAEFGVLVRPAVRAELLGDVNRLVLVLAHRTKLGEKPGCEQRGIGSLGRCLRRFRLQGISLRGLFDRRCVPAHRRRRLLVRIGVEPTRERVFLLLVGRLLHDLGVFDGHEAAIRADADEVAVPEGQDLVLGEERAVEARFLAVEALAVLLDRVLAELLLVDAELDLRDVRMIDLDLPGLFGVHVRADVDDARRLVREVEDEWLGRFDGRCAESSFDEIGLLDVFARQGHTRRQRVARRSGVVGRRGLRGRSLQGRRRGNGVRRLGRSGSSGLGLRGLGAGGNENRHVSTSYR